MDDYERLVERCRENRIERRIENASISHARVLVKNLFAAALDIPADQPKIMQIQCGCALPSFYNDFVQGAERAMAAGVDIWLLLEEEPAPDNLFVNTVAANARGHIRVQATPGPFQLHFVVVGTSAYRIETDTSNIEAFANFNEPIIAAFAADAFNRNWQTSQDYTIPHSAA